ncbi:PAS domain-containing protein [Cytophaga sp. FL35]|uniref:PAS domain-containing protein n=1 Tax=Cytophaga sp. FL35 TaxID=1904456 RepID=UPI0016536810|nr:PAS domain-containing protein [Cytophaga sp. FL35]MBC6999092.1 PAS domain-containing protein [Cytophaga sp. FL35]
MREISHYDKAIMAFFKNRKITAAPLSSWDMSSVHFQLFRDYFKNEEELKQLAKEVKWKNYKAIRPSNIDLDRVIVVTNTELEIVYATDNIKRMSGFERDEVIGKKPSMFQGALTSESVKARIRNSIINEVTFEETITNYKKNGSPYSCWIKGEPIFNKKGKLVNFIAFEKEVA